MAYKYKVFQDNIQGLIEMPELRGNILAEVIQNIQTKASKCYMYYIYCHYQDNVPLFGTRFDVYTFVKPVAGSQLYSSDINKYGLHYALTHQTSMAWLFSDNLFE